MAEQVGVFDIIKMIVVLVIILFCTYYVTKLLAERASGVRNRGKGLFSIGETGENDEFPRVLHRMMVDKDSTMILLEYKGCEYLIAFSPGGVQVIEKRELTEEELALREENRQMKEQNVFSFSKYMDKFKESQGNKGVDNEKED